MSVKIEHRDQVMTAYLEGEIDHHSARPIREQIDDEAQQSKPQTLLLDFGRVSFMDSSGIGLVLGRVRLLQFWKGRVVLCGLSPSLGRMVELSGIGTLASIERRAG